MHGARVKKYGHPGTPPRQADPVERFWARVDRSGGPDACWPWTGWCDSFGYGRMGIRKGVTESGTLVVHRAAYELSTGESIPAGLHMDHLCRNPPCCNPSHLEPVTVKQNVERGLNGVLGLYCSNGHRYEPGSFEVRKSDNARQCLKCKLDGRRRRTETARLTGISQAEVGAICSVCDRAYGFRADGNMFMHTATGERYTAWCSGSGQPPRHLLKDGATVRAEFKALGLGAEA